MARHARSVGRCLSTVDRSESVPPGRVLKTKTAEEGLGEDRGARYGGKGKNGKHKRVTKR